MSDQTSDTALETPPAENPRRESMLFKMTAPARRSSPDATRQSLMVLLALAATCVSGYFTVTLSGSTPPRIIMAALFAGWFSMVVHSVRGVTPAR